MIPTNKQGEKKPPDISQQSSLGLHGNQHGVGGTAAGPVLATAQFSERKRLAQVADQVRKPALRDKQGKYDPVPAPCLERIGKSGVLKTKQPKKKKKTVLSICVTKGAQQFLVSGTPQGRKDMIITGPNNSPVSGIPSGRNDMTVTEKNASPVSGIPSGRNDMTVTEKNVPPVSGNPQGYMDATVTEVHPSDAVTGWTTVTHRHSSPKKAADVHEKDKVAGKPNRALRRKPRWGLKLAIERTGQSSVRGISSELDKFIPKECRYTMRQTGANTFVLNPATVEDNCTLLKVLKGDNRDDIFAGSKFTVEVPEDQRKPKQVSYAVIAKGIDRWTSEDDIKSELNDQGFRGVLLVERFRNGERVLPLCRIEFAAEKEAKILLNEGLYVGHARFRCERPHQKVAPLQCYKCHSFGHRKAQCPQGTAKCVACGEEAHTEKGTKCDRTRKCPNCQGPHLALFKGCPAFKAAVVKAKPDGTAKQSVAAKVNKAKPDGKAKQPDAAEVPKTNPEGKVKRKPKRTGKKATYAECAGQTVRIENDESHVSPSDNRRSKAHSPRELELCSKLIAFMGGMLEKVFRNGFVMNPNKAAAECASDIMSIVSSEARKHLGILMNPAELSRRTGLPGTKSLNCEDVVMEDIVHSGEDNTARYPPARPSHTASTPLEHDLRDV